jgi:hypothetical protein
VPAPAILDEIRNKLDAVRRDLQVALLGAGLAIAFLLPRRITAMAQVRTEPAAEAADRPVSEALATTG